MKTSIEEIKKEHGSIPDYISTVKRWIRELPDPCINSDQVLRQIDGDAVDWSKPTVLLAVDSKFTSVQHAEWLQSVLERIYKIEREIQTTDVEDIIEHQSGIPNSVGTIDKDLMVLIEEEKMSARDFVRSVREHVHKEMDITSSQIKALNDIYKQYEKI